MRGVRRHGYRPGDRSLFKGGSPHSHPQASRVKSSPMCSGVLPYDTGAGSHTSCKLTRNGRSQTATHGACNRPTVISTPPSSSNPAVEGRTATQGAYNRTTVVHPFGFVASGGSARRPGPACHATSATVTACKETAPPLAPMSRLLDCRTSAATRGSPARDPTVPIKCDDHGSVSHGNRHDS